jgi:hypothetical protein
MLFLVSGTIAAEHPDVADELSAIDRYLDRVGQDPFRLEPTIDFLSMEIPRVEKGALLRLLGLYETQGAIEQVEMRICPDHGEIVEPDEEGALWCGQFNHELGEDECLKETAYRVRPGLARLPSSPSAGDSVPAGHPGDSQSEPLPPLGIIRDLLLAAFDDSSFQRLFRYSSHPDLIRVQTRFADNDGMDDLVDKAIDYCQQRALLLDLLLAVKEANPAQYATFEPRLRDFVQRLEKGRA